MVPGDRHSTEETAGRRTLTVSLSPASARRTTLIVLALVVALWVASWAFSALGSFLFVLLLAWLLSVAMEPVVLWLVARGVRRGAATGLTMLTLLLVLAGLVELFGSLFVAQLGELWAEVPTTVSTALDWVNRSFGTRIDVDTIQTSLALSPEELRQLATDYGGGLLGAFGNALGFLFDALTILVFTYYFSADSPRLRQTIGSWLRPDHQRVFLTVWQISVEKTGGYVVSKVVLATLSAVFHTAFFWFIDVPYWLPLGIMAGIVGQFIPTIGTYIGVAVPALFTLFATPLDALWIVLFATVYQQLENYVFTPRVSRRTMDVHPAVALGAVIAGAALLGPVGAVVGIPLAAVAIAVLDTYKQRHALLPELANLESEESQQEPKAREVVEPEGERTEHEVARRQEGPPADPVRPRSA
ncbi:MAG TPA: AI-2E family transporter [Dermatophilaceae bacterium]|nr:AI-2E family transporter [Dermatophilaceae bacterium]